MRVTSRKQEPSSRAHRTAKARTARRPAAKVAPEPQLTLRARVVRARQHATIVVGVELAGLDRVELELEPLRVFSLDQTLLRESGDVRLLGKRDGLATLIARGFVGARAVTLRMVHVQCDGPTVRILSIGYIPGGTRG